MSSVLGVMELIPTHVVTGVLHRVRSVVFASVLALGFGACSDSTGSGPAPSATVATTSGGESPVADSVVGACDLLTASDLEVAGFTVVAGPAPDEAVPGDECIFELPVVENSVVPGRATIWLHPAEFGAAYRSDLYADSVAVEGIGVEAWSSSFNRLAEARLGDGRVVSVQLAATGPEDPTAALVALLAIAAGRA